MSYEKNVEKLEQIVKKLDNEKVTLEESLKLYSDGIRMAKDCLKELNDLKGQFELLNADMQKIEVEDE
ncbi:MAG: exodeoxyribonuclease VII small subunit [Clostridia bacterium]|nr:exodeoxyribonuclease VII small subunit [Clostridia bacterium]